MELYPHNELAYNKLKESLVENQRACVVQPTGTGKSFIIAKFLSDNPNKKFLCITSNNYIIKQFDNNFKKLFSNYDFVNYSTLISSQFNALLEKDYDYIVFDEFHRGGAEEWGNSIEVLLETHNKAKIIGLTATHIRNDVGEDGFTRNMADELFLGNIVHHLSLREAFDIGILPAPTYIKTLYDLGGEYQNIIEKINKSASKNKSQLKKYALEKKLDWEKSKGVEKVLKKYITKERNFIVFCKDVEHLENMLERVEGWFKTTFKKKVNIFKVYSFLADSSSQLEEYVYSTTNKKNEFNLLFAVQQLNEGLHAPNTHGVLFLRPTDSPIIYYQQLGRCLETKGNKPLVFDMVNNFKVGSIHQKFIEETDKVKSEYSYLKSNYSEYKFDFKVIDEVGDYRDIFYEIENELSSWLISFRFFKNLLEEKGYAALSRKEKHWLSVQRIFYKQNKYLNNERIELLNTLNPLLGFEWNLLPNDIVWENKYVAFKKLLHSKNGYKNLSEKEKRWFEYQKFYYKKVGIEDYKIKKLDELNVILGFDWKIGMINFEWDENFAILESLLKKSGWNGLTRKEKTWFVSQKVAFNKGILSEQRILMLNNLNPLLGFDWKINRANSFEESYDNFRNNLLNLKEWGKLSKKDKTWLSSVKSDYKRGGLDPKHISKLNELDVLLGFHWEDNLPKSMWINNYNTFKDLLEKKGWNGLTRKEKTWFKDCKQRLLKKRLTKEQILLLNELNLFLKADWKDSSKNYK